MVLNVKTKDEIRNLTYIIQNIVVKILLNIESEIILNTINTTLNNTEYNPERFPGLFLRFKHPKCVVIIFSNGKLILTGLKIFGHVNLVIERLILKLNEKAKIYIDRKSISVEVVNIVITANFYKQINLNIAAIKLRNAIYEPEVFPGLVYKTLKPQKSVFLIFSNGKIVLTGIRNENSIEPALINLGRMLDRDNLFMIT
jgi:transcription initiation factor TFIID TATA-box-binding protein